ncbi:MAG: putative transcriptional regulator ycf27 [Polaromonas sp.]|nr:putative transcriptional regulator ycf27 [Polaromonas sp.]
MIDDEPFGQSEDPARSRQVILVVEDEPLIAMMIEGILIDAGYEVVLAFNGMEALALAATISFLAAVVTDLNLWPGSDGRAVIQSLRKANPDLPAVVVTGYDPQNLEADLRGLGGPTGRLTKPFSEKQLIGCLTDVLTSTTGRASPQWSGRRENRVNEI